MPTSALVAPQLPASFRYDPAVTDVVTSVNASRGSTAGTTPLLFTGHFGGQQQDYIITLGLGGAACNISSFSATAITCMWVV